MNRRGFLGSILALAAAPAIVRAQSIMPIRPLVRPTLAEAMAIRGGMWTATSFDPWMIVLYDAAGKAVEMPFDAKPRMDDDGLQIVSSVGELTWKTDRDVTIQRITCRMPAAMGHATEIDMPAMGGPWTVTKGCNFTTAFPSNRVLHLAPT